MTYAEAWRLVLALSAIAQRDLAQTTHVLGSLRQERDRRMRLARRIFKLAALHTGGEETARA